MKRIVSFALIILVLTGCTAKDTLNGNDAESSQQKISFEAPAVSASQSYTSKEQTEMEAVSSLADEESGSAAIFYQECGLSMTPDLLPKSEHEKELLRSVGADIAKRLEEVPPEFEDRKKYSGQLFSYIYEDFDSDGIYEMFAEGSIVASIGIWFIDDEAAVMLTTNVGFITDEEPLVLDVRNRKFVIFKAYGDAARTTDYMYGLRDGIPYETSISKHMIDGTNEYGDVLVIQTTYDAFIDGAGDILGRTWKPYYFYADKDGDIKEYGGIEASLDFVRSMNGAEVILQEYLPEEAIIESIYYRDNGVVNINYFLEERGGKAMSYITLRYDGAQARLDKTERGVYEAAYLPKLAEYPAALPQYK